MELYFFVLSLCTCINVIIAGPLLWTPKCTDETIQLQDYRPIVNKIINQSVYGPAQNQSYNRLALFTDTFGNRLAGSKNLERSIDYLLDAMKREGFDNVHGEEVTITPWHRDRETLVMIHPKSDLRLAMLGLGSTVPTPANGIQAAVLVVRSFDELKSKGAQAKGKIVVFNFKYTSYFEQGVYRVQGASEAAKVGAVAALIRSLTPLSIDTPHTGTQFYSQGVKPIPAASITVEDAEMMQRMQNRGENVTLRLVMHSKDGLPTTSRNIIAEIKGSTHPNDVVLFGGHIDSWDVGKGAMDDGGGAFISWQVLTLIKQLGLKPKRTLRMIMWTAEEYGGVGGQAYYQKHKPEIKNFKFVMESDMGTFAPTGIIYYGNDKVGQVVKQITQLLKPINATKFQNATSAGSIGEDVTPWINAGVPAASLLNANEHYFYYHHSQGDTMTVQDPHEMNMCAALWTSLAYIMADVDDACFEARL